MTAAGVRPGRRRLALRYSWPRCCRHAKLKEVPRITFQPARMTTRDNQTD